MEDKFSCANDNDRINCPSFSFTFVSASRSLGARLVEERVQARLIKHPRTEASMPTSPSSSKRSTEQEILDLLAPPPATDSVGAAPGLRLERISDLRLNRLIHIKSIGRYGAASAKYLEHALLSQPEVTTHELITQSALKLLGIQATGRAKAVLDSCSGPDRNFKGMKLFFEGHFYGNVAGGNRGNFLDNYFDSAARLILQTMDRDIEETAKSNFELQYAKALSRPSDTAALGWAIHYIQDLTAPHHVTNVPALLPRLKQQIDTHSDFESYAHDRMTQNRSTFEQASLARYPEIRKFDLTTAAERDAFVEWVRDEAVKFADKAIHSTNKADWDQVLAQALPHAISVTMFVLNAQRGCLEGG